MLAMWMVWLVAGPAVQSVPADGAQAAGVVVPTDSLIAEARARPHALREALSEALRRAVRDSPSAREDALSEARALAAAYAVAWQDSFLVRQVALFTSWSAERRVARFVADSLRRNGVTAYGAEGPAVARRIWRRALARARDVPDSALMAAVAGNIGTAFLAEGQLDSAETWFGRAARLAETTGDLRVRANAIGALGAVAEDRGDLAGARRRYLEASQLRERVGDSRGLAADHNNLGLLAETMGDFDEAGRHFEAALAINRGDGREADAATNLVNLAGLAATAGDFVLAERRYRDALAAWRREGLEVEAAAALHGLGQLELRRGDYPTAQGLLDEAISIYQRTGLAAQAVAVRRDLAGALAGMGDLQAARDELSQAQAAAEEHGLPAGIRGNVSLSRADLATILNDHPEAERLYRESSRLYRQAGDAVGQAEADQGLGRLLLERGDYRRARALLVSALRAQRSAGNRRAAGVTQLSLGDVAAEQGDTATARRAYQGARAEFEALGDVVANAAARGALAELDLDAGESAVAVAGYRQALALVEDRRAPDVTWRLRDGLARALIELGQPAQAARELRLAIQAVEGTGQTFRAGARRSQFLSDKWEVYSRLARVEVSRKHPDSAFEASEQLRAREMLELLGRGRIASPDPDDGLAIREQDLRRRIGELSAAVAQGVAVASPVRGPGIPATDAAALEALAGAQEAYQELLVEMRERAPLAAALVTPATASWRDVSGRLDTGEAMVEYLVGEAETLAFVIRRDTLAVVPLGIGRRALSRLVEFARGTLEPPGVDRPDTLWRGPLHQLHEHLVAPVEEAGLLDGVARLVLVPHGELHYLPFAALMEAGPRSRFLVQRYELTTTPSASVWLALGRRHRQPGSGVLAMAPEDRVLPETKREVGVVARFAGREGEVLIGGSASEARFRREAPDQRIIHLATNGVFNRHNPLFSHVLLAPGAGEDGRLEVHEVFGLRLRADLVVLSACQTGLGSGVAADIPPGDDWVGLTRAFLSAGAGEVIATLWPVDDRGTAELMAAFYGRFGEGRDAVTALASAQREMLASQATSHPYYWAGFTVVGGAER
jgi:CHAT domain-containing protein/Tfp pilus assembly protein PilF